ncbi:MAG: rRNA maturation RNase YbeY [Candidatus Kerfeldbacteria bacterium]|nr:rRNA maturation RNase YbeY [Candidatus Kerfeldbacteria bacterium]
MGCEVVAEVRLPAPAGWFRRRVNVALRLLRYNPKMVSLALAFVGDSRVRRLNRRYRGRAGTTDVLSFPGQGGSDLGEILISVPQARRQARQFGTALQQELWLLAVHGLLHLAGFDHQRLRDRRRMQRWEQRLLTGRSLIRRSAS